MSSRRDVAGTKRTHSTMTVTNEWDLTATGMSTSTAFRIGKKRRQNTTEKEKKGSSSSNSIRREARGSMVRTVEIDESERLLREQSVESVSKKPIRNETRKVKVTSRVVFLRVGQIDTKNERYDAEVFIECSWEDDIIYRILADPNMTKNSMDILMNKADVANLNPNPLINLKHVINNISLLEYDPSMFWSPQLFIDNAIGDTKEDIKYKLEIVEKDGHDLLNDPDLDTRDEQCKHLIVNNLTVRVYEIRKVKGVFYERLELQDFPMDMQELSITLTSQRSDREVEFVRNLKNPCSINTSDFLDQQQWDLDTHVRVHERKLHDPWRKYDRNSLSVSCLIVRKPGYYLLNAYLLIFLITVLGFVPFSFNVDWPHFRCTVTGLFLLTSVNFRYIITQRLPSVAYLTSLDKYAIGSLLILVTFCCWHAIVSSNAFALNDGNRFLVDDIFLVLSAVFYLVYNLFYLFWFLKMYRSNKSFQFEFEKENKPADSRASAHISRRSFNLATVQQQHSAFREF